MVESERDFWERALTQLEDLHAVANDNEAETEETCLETVEKGREGVKVV